MARKYLSSPNFTIEEFIRVAKTLETLDEFSCQKIWEEIFALRRHKNGVAESELRNIGTSTTSAEEKKLLRQVIQSELKTVVRFAERNQGKGLSLEDLVQEGSLGLSLAITNYELEAEMPFQKYASKLIKKQVSNALNSQNADAQVPKHMFEVIKKLEYVENYYISRWDRLPTSQELGEILELENYKINEIRKYRDYYFAPQISIEGGFISEEKNGNSDAIPGIDVSDFENSVENAIMKSALSDAIKNLFLDLTEREALIILYRFGLNGEEIKSLDEIGEILGVTQERVRQLETKVMSKLKHPQRAQALKDFLSA